MLARYMTQGRVDALRRLGLEKHANTIAPGAATHLDLGPAGLGPGPSPAAAPAAAGGLMGRAKAFGSGQLDAAKALYGNLRQGLGGAPTPEAGQLARGAAVGNLKTLAPSLIAGGGLYMLHRHHQQAEEQRRQQQMMQGGYGPM